MGARGGVAEKPLALTRAKEKKDLPLAFIGGVLGEDTEKLLRRRVGLDIRAPGQQIPACRDQLPRHVVAPDSGPATLGCPQRNRFVAKKTRDEEKVENLIDHRLLIGRRYTNSP